MYPQDHLNPLWITNGITDPAVDWANSFAHYLTDGQNALTTSQIRKFFGELKRIQADYERFIKELPMLKAQLAYAVGRNRNSRIAQFNTELNTAMNAIRPGYKDDFQNFVKIAEAIVAYHKFHGGR